MTGGPLPGVLTLELFGDMGVRLPLMNTTVSGLPLLVLFRPFIINIPPSPALGLRWWCLPVCCRSGSSSREFIIVQRSSSVSPMRQPPMPSKSRSKPMLGMSPRPPSFAMGVAAPARLAAEEGRRDRVLRMRVRLRVREELFNTGEGLREADLEVGDTAVGVLLNDTDRG